MTRPAEVVIVGAGPVGLALAALLATGPAAARLRIRVLDPKGPAQWDAEHLDARVYALSRASQEIFAGLGLWESIRARRASPYRHMRVWEGDSPDACSLGFDCADIGEPDLGHIVEDCLLRETLTGALAADGRVELDFGIGVEALAPTPAGLRLTLTGGRTTTADLAVAADGGASRMRALLAMPVVERSYHQRALVAHVTTSKPHAATAWQRFLPGGPLAFLPLADGRSSIVWSVPQADARTLLADSDAGFLAALQAASADVLGTLGPLSERVAFPLVMRHAIEYCRPGVALVGDAAHCVHPLAGQGMNLGLMDAACLAQVLTAASLAGEHLGDLRVLGRYARARKAGNVPMLLACDALDRLFRLPAWLAPARRIGLGAVDRAGPTKRLLMRQAMGLAAARRREQYGPPHGLKH